MKFENNINNLLQVLKHSPISTCVTNADLKIVYANLAFADMVGLATAERAIGSNLVDFVHGEDRRYLWSHLQMMQADGTSKLQAEIRMLSNSGQAHYVGAHLAKLERNRTDTELKTVFQFTDISVQKHAVAGSDVGDGRLAYALDAARQGVWDLDFRAGTAYYSNMWRQMRGIGSSEKIDSDIEAWLSRVHPNDRDRLRIQSQKQNSGELTYNTMEYRELHRAGHYIWILSRGRAIEWFEDGNVARMMGTDTDISAMKLVEEQLEDEKERLRITLESIGDGVISIDNRGVVTFINPAANKMIGCDEAAVLGMPLETVFKVEKSDLAAQVDPRVGLQAQPLFGRSAEDDLILTSRDGCQRDIHCTFAPVHNREGEVTGQVLVFKDISQSRELTRMLSHSATHDTLTGMPNRLAFERALANAFKIDSASGRDRFLLMIDLDWFKHVNDGAGHAAGDALLRLVANSITDALRSEDFASRIGGDEFTVILAECSTSDAIRIAQNLIRSVSKIELPWGGSIYQIGASIGLSAFRRGGSDQRTLTEAADRACYTAKSAGGGCVAYRDNLFPSQVFVSKIPMLN